MSEEVNLTSMEPILAGDGESESEVYYHQSLTPTILMAH